MGKHPKFSPWKITCERLHWYLLNKLKKSGNLSMVSSLFHSGPFRRDIGVQGKFEVRIYSKKVF